MAHEFVNIALRCCHGLHPRQFFVLRILQKSAKKLEIIDRVTDCVSENRHFWPYFGKTKMCLRHTALKGKTFQKIKSDGQFWMSDFDKNYSFSPNSWRKTLIYTLWSGKNPKLGNLESLTLTKNQILTSKFCSKLDFLFDEICHIWNIFLQY